MDSDFVKYGHIALDCPNGAYYPGQIVSGTVQFQFSETHTFSVITVQIIGQADVFWTERNEDYNGTEQYFNCSKIIFGDEARTTPIRPGNYKVPFDFQLKDEIPSSLEEENGKIWYKVYAHAEFLGGQGAATIERNFTVVTPFDLNASDINKTPVEMEFHTTNSCCFYGDNDNVSVRVQCDLSGFCPGQRIPLRVTVDNKSSIEVISVKLMLTSKTGYRCTNPEVEFNDPTKVLRQAKVGPFLSKTCVVRTVELPVPDMIALNLEFCNIICVQYYIKVKIKYSGLNEDEENESEICIGSIPVEGTDDNYVQPLKDELPMGPIPKSPMAINIPVQNQNVVQGNPPYGNMPYGNAQNGNMPYGNALNGNMPYGNALHGNMPYGSAQSGNMPQGNVQNNVGFVQETSPPYPQMPMAMPARGINYSPGSDTVFYNKPSAPPE